MIPASLIIPFVFAGFVFSSSAPAPSSQGELRVRSDGTVSEVVVELPVGPVVLRRTVRRVQSLALRRVPNASALAATWSEGGEPWYALSLDGRSFHEAQATSYGMELRYARFDGLRGAPVVPQWLDGERGGGRLYIVQYWTQGLDAYRDALRALGAKVHFFLAQHANVVEIDRARLDELRALEFVRWVGPFHPAYKLEEELRAELELAAPGDELRKVNVLSTERGDAGQAPILALVRKLGGRVDAVSEHTHLVTVELPLARLVDLARLDAVQWIDRWGPPGEDMDIARSFHGANYVESTGNYLGQGVRVEVMDGGCDTSHPDLQNFLVHTTNFADAHGTCTSGIVLGSGAGNFSARGVMPSAFLVVGNYNNFAGGSRYNHTAELQNPALVYKCVLQSNSWGNAQTTAYTSISQDMDLILFDHQRFSILQSQSNLGNQNSRPEAWAKNVISVGGIYHFNTETKSDDSWSFGASIGPAADGRLKPDLASFYDATLCTDVVGAGGYASGNYYSSFGGTSGATPITAGHLGLVYQMWSDGVFGNATPGSTVFDNRPYNTTMKALLVNTATQWTFSGTAHDLTRTHQGWGHVDLRTVWDQRNSMYIVDESDVLTNLASTVHSLTVQAGTTAFKATLVYRDPPGTTSSTQHRINNMDLKVTAPGGTIYWGNNGLNAGNWSTSGGTANTKDTVENVLVASPAAGTWQVQVIAAELNQDAHVETGPVDADYALVVTGVTTTPPTPPAAPTGLTATAVSSSQIDLAWSDNSNNETAFEIERSTDGSSFTPRATVGANETTFQDTGLAGSTTYWYRVNATNGGGDSGYSNVASATTPPPSATLVRASGSTAVAGRVTGNHTATFADDGSYHAITEKVSGGSPSTRFSFLEHKWTFSVPAGATKSFHLEGHHTVSPDGDDFVFSYSTDDVNYTDLLTVTKTADDPTYQQTSLPAGVTGTVYIRVRDTIRSPGSTPKDTVRVDDMYIRVE
jgi:subtilase family protein/fibronectin type III domain protein